VGVITDPLFWLAVAGVCAAGAGLLWLGLVLGALLRKWWG